jgi:hypothetical protein
LIKAAFFDFSARDLIDEDGRPVAEVASPHYRQVATDLVACPYPDARRGEPMNRSALVQMGSVWPSILASVRAMAGAGRVADALRVAAVGLAAPVAFDARSPGAPIPRLLASFFKTSLGMSQTLVTLLLSDDGVADAKLTELGDRDAFFATLDQGRWLFGATQVCAGSKGHIGDLFDAMAGHPGRAELDPTLAALDPDALGRDATHAIAASIVALCRAADRVRAGLPVEARDRAWLSGDVPPWLRSVMAIPNRPAAHALRLFPAGGAPASLVRALADPPR